VRVADLADRNPDLFVGRDEDVAEVLGRPAFVRVGRAIVVGPSGEASGLLSITDVERAVRATVLAPGGNGSRADTRLRSAKR
jgi:predicted transcriptional regulator